MAALYWFTVSRERKELMNPVFSRRYRGGSRPNIMPTARQQNYKSSSNPGSSGSNQSDSFGELSLGESGDEYHKPPLEDKPLFTKQSARQGDLSHHKKEKIKSSGDEVATRNASQFLAQQLLANKQNMLAQASLSPLENRQRGKQHSRPGLEHSMPGGLRHSLSTEEFGQSSVLNSSAKVPRSPTVHGIGHGDMSFCDIDDDDLDFGKGVKGTAIKPLPGRTVPYTPSQAPTIPKISRPNLNQRISKEPLDMKTWRELKRIVCGTGSFHDGWIGQGFIFDTNIPFGLIQKKGGPCGVLAVVQSLLVRNLLFGSSFSDEHDLTEKNDEANVAAIRQFLLENGNEDCAESIRKSRVQCLVDAVAEIIWTCAQQRRKDEGISAKDCASIIMLSDSRIQAETIRVSGRSELQHFLQNSIHRFDCIALIYSAVLTRGISGVKEDMDFENCSLVGQHGYCSQELINLLCLGRAISNTFDNEIELDGKVLRGTPTQCDIGLLSLFEHYDSIKVGCHLKCPRYPVWIICSESHYSVLFSFEQSLCNSIGSDGKPESLDSSFDLFYYDGLSRQEKVIRLSICLSDVNSLKSGRSWDRSQQDFKFSGECKQNRKPGSSSGGAGSSMGMISDDDLVPPLEKCIRTKWQGAVVNWNDTEPIL